MLSFDNYLLHLKDKTIFPIFKIAFLFPDESVQFEIVEDMLNNGNLSINYNQGVRRSCNITLYNFHKKYLPSENNVVWINRKFKLFLGTRIDGEEYWVPNGVFVISNPDLLNNFAEKTITINGIDKFSLLDSTLGGELSSIYQISQGENIYSAIKTILAMPKGNGYPIDPIEPILDNKYKDATLPYTIRKEAGSSSLGEILIELANSISCDIFYDTESHLRLQSGITDLGNINKSSLWDYTTGEAEYLGMNMTYKFDAVYNKIKILADNINGNIATGEASNTNPFSPTRISLIGERTKVISDNVISTDASAVERSQYELRKFSILPLLGKLNSTYLAHLDVDNCISISDDYYNFDHERFLIQSLNIPLSVDSKTSLDICNIRDLPYYSI